METITVFMEHAFRYQSEKAKSFEDYHSFYGSARAFQIVVGTIPADWNFSLVDSEGNPLGGEDSIVKWRMKAVITTDPELGTPTVVERTMTYDGEAGKFTVAWDDDDFKEANFFLGKVILEDDSLGKLISPKPLRVNVTSE